MSDTGAKQIISLDVPPAATCVNGVCEMPGGPAAQADDD